MKTNIQILAFGLLILVAFVVACGSEDEAAQPVDDVPEAMSAVREPPERPDREPLIESEITADGFKAILGTGDLGVGTERIGFVLTSKTGFVTTDGVQITPRYVSPTAQSRPGPPSTPCSSSGPTATGASTPPSSTSTRPESGCWISPYREWEARR